MASDIASIQAAPALAALPDDDGRHYYVHDRDLRIWICLICSHIDGSEAPA